MPRKKLKKFLPTHDKIKKQKVLRIFGKVIHKREIWSLSRKKVLAGVFIGVFVSCLPMPFQTVLAVFLAIIFNANLPISFSLVFISNPVTMPVIFYFEYVIGNFLLGSQNAIEFNFNSMYDNFDKIAVSMYLGSIALGIVLAILSVFLLNILWINSVKKSRKNKKKF
ncbi:MAG: DUF2062 domain-containing protein [Arcobacter sp.]|nr:DUF2062 domain-containing protein [Arcobacter sp.]